MLDDFGSCHAVHDWKKKFQETPYEQSFVSAMVPKLEYDALLKAGHGMASGHIRAPVLISDVTSHDQP